MATSRSSKKRIRQNERRRLSNKSYRSALRTEIKKFGAAVTAGDGPQAADRFRRLSRRLDKMVTKGIIRKNQAGRRKSSGADKLRALSASPSS